MDDPFGILHVLELTSCVTVLQWRLTSPQQISKPGITVATPQPLEVAFSLRRII